MQQKLQYLTNPSEATLLVIDPQKAFGQAVEVPNVESALYNMRRALKYWRELKRSLFFTEHVYESPADVGRIDDYLPGIYQVLHRGSPLAGFHGDIVEPKDIIISKNRFNAAMGTDLIPRLRKQGIKMVVIAGLTTPICVQTTVDALMMSDYQVVVLEDACASQAMGNTSAQDAHRAAIERMRTMFAHVITTDEFIAS